MMGAASTPVFLVIFNGVLLLLVAIPIALVIQFAWGGTWSSAAIWGMLGSVLMMSTGGYCLFWLWWRRRRQRPIDLTAWWLSSPRGGVAAGEKATGLHHLDTLGFSIAEGWVLALELLSTPAHAARRISICCRRRGIDRVILRSSFQQEDAEQLYPGVFRSVVDVDARDVRAISDAIESVVASGSADIVDRYRLRSGGKAPVEQRGCVIVQQYVPASIRGVLCSFHPSRRRLDEVTIEAGPTGERPSVDVYSQLLRRWVSKDSCLENAVRQELLGAMRAGEAFLKGPVVIEFGVHDESLLLFQLRHAPKAAMIDVWTQSGPVGLNPEPLPRLFSEILYGPDLELLRQRLESSLSELVAPGAPRPNVETVLHLARPLIEYGSVASHLRFHPRVHGPVGLVTRLLLKAKAAATAGQRALSNPSEIDDVDGVRHLATVQSRCLEASEDLRTLDTTLSSSIGLRPEFAPIIPWHPWLSTLIKSKARAQERLRECLHSELISSLESLKPSDPSDDDWHHLTLEEWRRALSGGPLETSPAVLRARREAFEQDRPRALTMAFVKGRDGLTTAPPWPPPEREETKGVLEDGRLELHPLVRGDATGTVVFAEGIDAVDDHIVIVPDASIRWLDRIVGARGVLLVGGSQLLSHLALAILELDIPTLTGLTSQEAAALEGRKARIDGERLVIEGALATLDDSLDE